MATDSRFFRVRTDPDYYKGVNEFESRSTAYRTVLAEKNTVATPDSRFPGWAAPMSDGRLITDYRSHCAANIPAGKHTVEFKFEPQVVKTGSTIALLSSIGMVLLLAGGVYFERKKK